MIHPIRPAALAVLLLAFTAHPAPPAPETPTPPPPAPAPTAAPAPAPAPRPIIPAIHQAVLPALVKVKITVLEDPLRAYERRTATDAVFDEVVRQHISLRLAAVRIAPSGTLIIRDPGLPLDRYGAIELHDPSGRTTPAKIAAILQDCPAVILQPTSHPPSSE